MDSERFYRHKLRNAFQSLLLVLAMAALLGYLAWAIGGWPLALFALGVVGLVYAFNPVLSPRLILRLLRGRVIRYEEAPRLHAVLAALAARAHLPRVPTLYYIPSDVMNAFSTGTREEAVIAVSDGLLRRLGLRELAGVLAHELTHIRHNDIRVMTFADLTGRLTGVLSALGQFLLLVNLPLLLFSDYRIAWLPILVLIFAPTLSALTQLALSRSREYEADLGAVQLTADPQGLASALEKMERYQGRLLEQILLPGQRLPEPSLLRTHPATEERVRRLLDLRGQPAWETLLRTPLDLVYDDHDVRILAHRPLRPRWHRSGLWY